MNRDQVTRPTVDGAERVDPSDETVINGEAYDPRKAIRSGTESLASLGLDADLAKQ